MGMGTLARADQTSDLTRTFPWRVSGTTGAITTPISPTRPLEVVLRGRWFGAT